MLPLENGLTCWDKNMPMLEPEFYPGLESLILDTVTPLRTCNYNNNLPT